MLVALYTTYGKECKFVGVYEIRKRTYDEPINSESFSVPLSHSLPRDIGTHYHTRSEPRMKPIKNELDRTTFMTLTPQVKALIEESHNREKKKENVLTEIDQK